jgi:hypothetical protein
VSRYFHQFFRGSAFNVLRSYDKGRKLSGFIYLQRISDPRFGGQSSRSLRMFQNLCGPDASKNIIVLTTFWDKVTDEIGAQREKQLKENYFKQLVDCGACFMRHDRTFQSAQDVLRHILPLVPTDTLIGKEIVDDGKDLDETAAGSVHVEVTVAKHKNEMAELTGEIVVIRKTNKALARELLTERAKLEEKLAKWENERFELKKALEDEKNAMVQLKADAEAEKGRYEKWRQEKEHELIVGLDSEASKHSKALKDLQHQLEQEREKFREIAQGMGLPMGHVDNGLKDKRREEELSRAFDMVREQVTLSGLSDIKVVGGGRRHMDATVVADILNRLAIDITVSSSVKIFYDQSTVCRF